MGAEILSRRKEKKSEEKEGEEKKEEVEKLTLNRGDIGDIVDGEEAEVVGNGGVFRVLQRNLFNLGEKRELKMKGRILSLQRNQHLPTDYQ